MIIINKFWNWVKNEASPERTLYLNGIIAEESWWGDEVTPKMFKDELNSSGGDITVWVNSLGGDVWASAQIYNMLKEYPHKVTVKIDGIAASAASVVAMAGDEVLMSPVAVMMIHDPSTIAYGDAEEMRRAKQMLDETKESLINAYQLKTKLSRVRIAHMMSEETWLSARKAVELGFADNIMFTDAYPDDGVELDNLIYSKQAVFNSFLSKLAKSSKPVGKNADTLYDRLNIIIH